MFQINLQDLTVGRIDWNWHKVKVLKPLVIHELKISAVGVAVEIVHI